MIGFVYHHLMLSNAYPTLFIMSGMTIAILGLFLAVVIEIPILSRLWHRPLRTVFRTVLVANLISAVAGIFPVAWNMVSSGPGLNADAWDVYQNYWPKHYQNVAWLFGLTLAVEWGWFLAVNRFSVSRLTIYRLLLSIAAANVASYVILVVIVFLPTKTTPDFEFIDNTRWLSPTQTRLWYCDSETQRLCSIQLDGSDRREETDVTLGQFEPIWDRLCVYTLLEDGRVLVVDEKNNWIDCAEDKRKSTGHPFDATMAGRFHYYQLWPLIEPMLVGSNPIAASSTASATTSQVYFSRLPMDQFSTHVESERFVVSSYVIAPNGNGNGLNVVDNRSNQQLRFALPIAFSSLACRDPIIVDDRLIVFRCSGTICVMDFDARKVGKLALGHSIVIKRDEFGPPELTESTMIRVNRATH